MSPAIRTKLVSGINYVDHASSDYVVGALRKNIGEFEYYSPYTTAFEQYRCLSLTFHYLARNTVYQRDATGVVPPIMAVAPNFDDNTAPTASTQGLAALMMKPACKVRHPCQPAEFTLTCTPRVLMDVADSPYVTADASKTWISTLDTTSYFYGFKYMIIIDHQAMEHMYTGTFWVTGIFEFRGQHGAAATVAITVKPVPEVKQAGSTDEEEEAVEYVRVKRIK